MAEAKKLALAQRLFFLYFSKHGLPQTPRHTAAGTKFSAVKIEISEKFGNSNPISAFSICLFLYFMPYLNHRQIQFYFRFTKRTSTYMKIGLSSVPFHAYKAFDSMQL